MKVKRKEMTKEDKDFVRDLSERVEEEYSGRHNTVPEIASKLNMSNRNVRKTLRVLGYDYGIKRTPENCRKGKLITPVYYMGQLRYLTKYNQN